MCVWIVAACLTVASLPPQPFVSNPYYSSRPFPYYPPPNPVFYNGFGYASPFLPVVAFGPAPPIILPAVNTTVTNTTTATNTTAGMCVWLLSAACFGVAPIPQQPLPFNPFPNFPGYPAIISGGPAPAIFFPTTAPAPAPNATTPPPPGNATTTPPPLPGNATTTTLSPNATTTSTLPTLTPPTTTTIATTTLRPVIPTLPTLTPVPTLLPPTTGITPPANVTPTQQPIPTVPPIDPRTITGTTPQLRFGNEENSNEDVPIRFGEQDDIIIDLDGESDTVNFPRDRRQTLPCGCYTPAQCKTDMNTNGIGLIDFRIVTGGTGTCSTGLQYCCPSSTMPLQVSCGTRIMGSSNYPTQPGQARYGEFPWMAVIMTSNNTYVGGGVLIDQKNILTTAHRIVRFPNGIGLKIRLGEWDAAGNYEQFPFKDYSISNVWTHESFNPSTLQNDLAVIRIVGMATVGLTAGAVPICLPAMGQSFEGQRCWVSGWGKDSFGVNGRYQNIIKTVDVPVIASTTCESTLRTTRLGQYFILDRMSFVCAGGEANKDACTGDGGSGLVCETSPGKWTLAGLVAWGVGCASQGVPAAYVNVPNYVSWIQARQSITF